MYVCVCVCVAIIFRWEGGVTLTGILSGYNAGGGGVGEAERGGSHSRGGGSAPEWFRSLSREG